MAAASLPCINHSVSEGVVNLIQVAGVATGDSRNAGRDAARAVAVLDLQQKRARVDGKGKEVLVGSYEDALKVAEYLGASDETMVAIRAALQKMPEASGASGASTESDANEAEESAPDKMLSILQSKEISEETARRLVLPALEVREAFPIRYDEHWAAYMGYSRYDKSTDRIKALINDGDLIVDTDVRLGEERELSSGHMCTVYYFSLDGIKLFFMAACTPEARKFKMYFVKIEKEYQKVLPELEKLQEELEAQKKETDRLKKEMEESKKINPWKATRQSAVELQKEAMASLHKVVKQLADEKGEKLYGVVNNAINKAVLGYKEFTTSEFKQNRGIPDKMSIPDILAEPSQRERMHVLEMFRAYFANNRDVLRNLSYNEIVHNIEHIARQNGHLNVLTGGDMDQKLLPIEEAKKLKRERETNRNVETKAKRIRDSRPNVINNITNNNYHGNALTINNAPPKTAQKTLDGFFGSKK